jgi:hypothetical protein
MEDDKPKRNLIACLALVVALASAVTVPAAAQQRHNAPPHKPPPPALQPPPPGLGEQHDQPPASEHQDAQPDRRGTVDAPLIVEMHNPPKTEIQAAENAAEEERKASTDRWTIRLTVALVVATGLQFLALGYQGYWLRRTVKVAEQSLTDLEAPFVYIEITRPGIVHHGPQQTDYADLRFRFVNHGRTPAHIIKFAESILVAGIDQPPPILEPSKTEAKVMPWGVISPPNGGSTYEFTHSFLDSGDVGVLKVDEQSVFFLGWFIYMTIFGTGYISGFCFKFNPANNSFVREGGGDYNYLRKETSPRDRTRAPSASNGEFARRS